MYLCLMVQFRNGTYLFEALGSLNITVQNPADAHLPINLTREQLHDEHYTALMLWVLHLMIKCEMMYDCSVYIP
jgi:hypothetical protein